MSNDQNNSSKTRIVLCVELLKNFTIKELDRFESFISHPYFNKNKRLCVLLSKLRQYTLANEIFSTTIRVKIYETVFKEKLDQKTLTNSQYNRLNELLNKLLALAEQFLKVEKVKDTDRYDAELLYPELINRNQLMLYSRRLNAIEKKLSNVKKRGTEYYNQCYHIQREKARLLFIENNLVKKDNYDKLQYYLDVKYILEQLSFYLLKITTLKIYAHKKFDLSSFHTLKKLINLPQHLDNPLIRLSLLNIDLVEKENDKTFKALLSKLETANNVPISYLKPFYTNLTNYCVWQQANGRLEFTQYLYEIYNGMHEYNLLLMRDAIDIGLLKNIIINACRVSEFDWAKEKLAYYRKYIPKNIRNDVFKYNNGIIAFHQKKYSDALYLLVRVKKIDDTYDLGLRMVQLQCFYETDLGYEISTQQMISSLKKFIKENKKLVNRQKTAYFNFIFIFNKLYKFRNLPNSRNRQNIINKRLPKIKERLLQYDLIREKKWLLSKIEILEKF